MLDIQSLCASYGKSEVLHDISFPVRRGRITVLLGPNGSGKSTLLRCVAGEKSHKGQILLEGQRISEFSRKERAQRVGVFPQLLPNVEYTVRELARFGRIPYLTLLGRETPEGDAIVEHALTQTDMLPFAERPVNLLSGGERQRAFLALLLAQQAPLLLLDEPMSFMDPSRRRELYALLQKMRDEGKTVLAVLHDLSEAMAIAEDVILLEEGCVRFYGTKEALLESTLCEEVFRVTRYVTVDDKATRIFFA